jgi:beta-galactosidase GanA
VAGAPLQRGFAVADVTAGPGSTLEKIPQAGFGWVQGWISWRRLEPAPGSFAWAAGGANDGANDLDNVARGAAAYGLQALVRV